MEGLFQLFQVFGCNGVIACNDIVYHSGTIEEMGYYNRRIQIIVHGFIAFGT
jgi:hypothetical protein